MLNINLNVYKSYIRYHTVLKTNLKFLKIFLKASSYSQILFKDSVKILHKVFSVLVF